VEFACSLPVYNSLMLQVYHVKFRQLSPRSPHVTLARVCLQLLVSVAISKSVATFCGWTWNSTHPHVHSRNSRYLRRQALQDSPYQYKAFEWLFQTSTDQQVLDVVQRIPDMETIWPTDTKVLSRGDFRAFMRSRGGDNNEMDDNAIESVFNAFSGASSFIFERERVEDALRSWKPSGTAGGIDVGAVQRGVLIGRLSVLGAWLFLNAFAPWATYFVIIRGPLFNATGWDLIPNVPRWWEGPV